MKGEKHPGSQTRDLLGVVVAASSRIALGVLHACSDLTVSVPDQMSIAAHGNPEWYEVYPPGITSYAPPLAEMGRAAAERILAKLGTSTGIGTPTITRIRGTVHERRSIRDTTAPSDHATAHV